MRCIDIVVILAEQPVSSGHQVSYGARLRPATLLRFDGTGHPLHHFLVETANKETDTFLPAFFLRIHPERRNSPAHPVLIQNQLETFNRVHTLAESNLDELVGGISGLDTFNG